MNTPELLRVTVAVIASLLFVASPLAAQQANTSGQWTTAWSTSQNGLATTAITNATVRVIARVTIPGNAVRIRLANTYGKAPLTVGKVYIGQRVQTATLAAGSNIPVLFKGSASVTIPQGGEVISDPVKMEVPAQQDLAVSLYIPDANVRASQHGGALVTSYVTANGIGDVTADEVPFPPGQAVAKTTPFTATVTSMPWLKAIDVSSPGSTAIVAIGDSITDGSCATVDGYDRWVDWLAIRLNLAGGGPKAVLNEGIGGNTVTRENLQPPVNSDPAVERLDRDVLSHQGVTHVILFEGTNDIRRDGPPAQLIAGMQDIIKRVKARGIKIIGATIIPRHNYPQDGTNTGWNDAKSKRRHEVNEWIRTRAGFDAVLDFDKTMRDPANPERNLPMFHCDGIHPSPRGYYAIGQSIPLNVFDDAVRKATAR